MRNSNDTERLVCWSCKVPVEASALFCGNCSAIQPPGQLDAFSRFGLPQDFRVNMDVIEATYIKQQRLLHPDRFATKSAREQVLSSQQAVSLNKAFQRLKNPVSRAQDILRLAGKRTPGQEEYTVKEPVLLMEAMEMREALEEAPDCDALDVIIRQTRKIALACEAQLSQAFDTKTYETAGNLTVRLQYLTKIIKESRARKARLSGVT